jgi:hypothetical protein
MKKRIMAAVGIALPLVLATPAHAGPATGSTTLLDPTVSGQTVDVEVAIDTLGPVVPFGYAIQNECAFPSRSGKSLQRDDIVYWTFEDGGVPHAVMPVYLQSVPTGSKCKVFLVKNNTVVKGSTTAYLVG